MSLRTSTNDKTVEAATFFEPGRLTLARHLAGIRKNELASRVGKNPSVVAAWESGAKRPTSSVIAQLALSLSVDTGFFTSRPNYTTTINGTPHFRSLRSTSQLSREQASAYGQVATDVSASLERHVKFPAPDIPKFPVSVDDSSNDEAEQASKLVRNEWGIENGPCGHLVRILEIHGVLVCFSPPQVTSIDAFSFETGLRPVVVLNTAKADFYRQRFDVAHELGHLVMHGDAEPGGRIAEEQANRFAAEFLMPAEVIFELLPTRMNDAAWTGLARLKEQWGVSIQALLYRARWLGRLSPISYRNAMSLLSSRGWRRSEPGVVDTTEQPSLLPRAVELLKQEGIDESELIDESNLPPNLFRSITSRIPTTSFLSAEASQAGAEQSNGKVISLFEWREKAKARNSLFAAHLIRDDRSSFREQFVLGLRIVFGAFSHDCGYDRIRFWRPHHDNVVADAVVRAHPGFAADHPVIGNSGFH